MSGKDYYKVLGLEKNVTDKQIKASYFELAKKWHPDKNPDNKDEATQKFNQISEAYNILKDPVKRQRYDNFGDGGLDDVDHTGSGPFGFDPFAMFRDFFQKDNDVPDIQVQLKMTLEELYMGAKKKVKYERYTLCSTCDSKGAIGDNIGCNKCDGKGININKSPFGFIQSTCRYCNGKGINLSAPKCNSCGGMGCLKEEFQMTIQVPKGSSERHPIMIENEGNEIPKNERRHDSNRSNVIIIISEISHQKFNRGTVIKEIGKIDENNLLIEVKLTLEESLCGFEKTFTFLDEKLFKFSLNEPTKHGEIYVMKEYGMPYFGENNKKGDLFIKIFVENKKLSNEQKSKLWKLLSSEPYVEIKKSSQNLINFNEYKTDTVNENKKESMKDKYRRRKEETMDEQNEGPQCTSQ